MQLEINSCFDVRRGRGTSKKKRPAKKRIIITHTHTRRESGEKSRRKDYLPDDKQYLVTKNVPCVNRANDLDNVKSSSDVSTEDDWLITEEMKHSVRDDDGEMQEITVGDDDDDNDEVVTRNVVEEKEEDDDDNGSDSDDYLDMETFEEDNLLDEEDVGELDIEKNKEEEVDNIKLTRTYDVSITYDKYYQTPRVFLFGYNESGQPLKTKEIYQDIMADYVKRTVTMEKHPHRAGGELQAAIHPCRHAAVMKSIIGHLVEGGKIPVVDQYLFIFLKFIQSVVPTINYDFTFSIAAR